MSTHARERKLLQTAVVIGALLPVVVGIFGIACGLCIFDAHASISGQADSHVRYLSGLILAIGVGFLSTVTDIEGQGDRFRLLAMIVWTGGWARMVMLVQTGSPTKMTALALVMELVVTPGLALWRERLERRKTGPQPCQAIAARPPQH